MHVGAACPTRASHEHGVFRRLLEGLGARVHSVPFVHGAFDSVFSKDNAVVVARKDGAVDALLASPRHVERRTEQRARAMALRSLGVVVHEAPADTLEGGDVVMMPGATGAFVGHGFRTSPRAARELERFLGHEVVPVELRDPRLYHLDMALSMLDDGTALVCREAISEAAWVAIHRHRSVRRVVDVSGDEALHFGVNLVQVGRDVVSAANAPEAMRALEQLGYRVHRVTLDQFHHAGGSAACLVSRIHAQSDVGAQRRPTAA